MLRYWVPLYAFAIILQIYFAGEGIFGAKDSTIDDANSLELHRGLGWIIAQPIALLFLITALLAWLPDKRQRWMTIALPILLFVQSILPSAGRWVAALHPVNAVLLLGLFGYLSWAFWRAPAPAAAAAPEEAPAVEPV
jgi:hypothetical protein